MCNLIYIGYLVNIVDMNIVATVLFTCVSNPGALIYFFWEQFWQTINITAIYFKVCEVIHFFVYFSVNKLNLFHFYFTDSLLVFFVSIMSYFTDCIIADKAFFTEHY